MAGHGIQRALWSAFAVEIELDGIGLHRGGMDIHPKRDPVEVAPVLGRAKVEAHPRASTLVACEGPVLLVRAKMLFVAHRRLEAQ